MASSESAADPPPDYYTAVQATAADTEAPPPQYEEVLKEDHAQGEVTRTKEYRIEYRSGEAHNNYGLILEEGRILSVGAGSSAAESGVRPGGRILVANGVDHRLHSHQVIAEHITKENERYSALTVLLEYTVKESQANAEDEERDMGASNYEYRQSQCATRCEQYSIRYKPGILDVYYGLYWHGKEITDVFPGSVAYYERVTPGGQIVKVNAMDLRYASDEVITQQLNKVYERKLQLSLTLEYSDRGPLARSVPRCSTQNRRYFLPFYPDQPFGFGYVDTEITEVIPGTEAYHAGLPKGGQILEVNGVPIAQLGQTLPEHINSIRQNRQALHLLVRYTGSEPRSRHENVQGQLNPGPNDQEPHMLERLRISESSHQAPQYMATDDTTRMHSRYRPYSRNPFRRMSVSWGENMIMEESEARILDLWSCVNFVCFCPLGTLAICFSVLAENAETREKMEKYKSRAYAANVAATILGIILIIVLSATLTTLL